MKTVLMKTIFLLLTLSLMSTYSYGTVAPDLEDAVSFGGDTCEYFPQPIGVACLV